MNYLEELLDLAAINHLIMEAFLNGADGVAIIS